MAVKTGWQYFSEAFESALKQSYEDWELLVGINGFVTKSHVWYEISTIFETAPNIYGNVLDLPTCKNKPQTLNTMVAIAKGEYIAILDVDDLWHPDKLTRQLPYLENYDVVGTMGEYFGNVTGFIDIPPGVITFGDLLKRNCLLNSSVVMRREIAIWPDTDGLDDYRMWLELAWQGKRLFNIDGNPLVKIRCHQEQHFAARDNSAEIRAEYQKRLQETTTWR